MSKIKPGATARLKTNIAVPIIITRQKKNRITLNPRKMYIREDTPVRVLGFKGKGNDRKIVVEKNGREMTLAPDQIYN